MGWIEQGWERWDRLSKDTKDVTDWLRIRRMERIKQGWEEWDGLDKDEKDGTDWVNMKRIEFNKSADWKKKNGLSLIKVWIEKGRMNWV